MTSSSPSNSALQKLSDHRASGLRQMRCPLSCMFKSMLSNWLLPSQITRSKAAPSTSLYSVLAVDRSSLPSRCPPSTCWPRASVSVLTCVCLDGMCQRMHHGFVHCGTLPSFQSGIQAITAACGAHRKPQKAQKRLATLKLIALQNAWGCTKATPTKRQRRQISRIETLDKMKGFRRAESSALADFRWTMRFQSHNIGCTCRTNLRDVGCSQ
mmetsp:Transcript_42285/g.123818  ORF Transcript_42285/g.123818 Transcript_42285/m.123818 type:complete len:212 (-) Transcript_42285:59-694(-)